MDKWQGSFAQSQLEKFGWESGEGLGKNRDGRTKHITVSKKNDKKGVGVGQDQWEFAWWDHLYNKSASEVTVEKDEQAQIKVVNNKKNKSKSDIRRSATGIISTERPTGKTISATTTTTTATTTTSMASMADAMNNEEQAGSMDSMVKDLHINMAQRIASGALYSGFVKSSTAPVYDPSAPNTPTETATSSGTNSDSDEDDELKDYSIKMTDAELFAACEGRTARKGGRGLVEQKGKFARVMQEYLHKNDNDDDDNDNNSKKRKHKEDDDDKKTKKKAKKDKKDKDGVKKVKKDKKDKKDKKEKKAKKDKKEKKAKKDKKKDKQADLE